MHLQLPQRVPHGEIRALDQPDDLVFLASRVSHVPPSESETVTLFLSSRFSRTSSASVGPQVGHVGRRGLAGGVPDQPCLAGFEKLLAPPVIEIRVQPLAATQGGNALLDAQALEDNPDLLFDRESPAGLPPDVLNDLLS